MERVCGLGGSTVGAYRLGDCLGHGSHTAVYHASRRGQDCVVKLVDARLQENGKLAARLRREAAVLDRVGGRGIVPIQDALRTEGLTIAEMPLRRAASLQDVMAGNGLDMEAAWAILSQIAESLHLVHQQGLVY